MICSLDTLGIGRSRIRSSHPSPKVISAHRRTLTVTPAPNANLHSYVVVKNMTPFWRVTAYGAGLPTVVLPDVPTDLVDPISGDAILTVSGGDFVGIDFNDASVTDYVDHLRAIATNSGPVNFNMQ